jgi:hypothetical protein
MLYLTDKSLFFGTHTQYDGIYVKVYFSFKNISRRVMMKVLVTKCNYFIIKITILYLVCISEIKTTFLNNE